MTSRNCKNVTFQILFCHKILAGDNFSWSPNVLSNDQNVHKAPTYKKQTKYQTHVVVTYASQPKAKATPLSPLLPTKTKLSLSLYKKSYWLIFPSHHAEAIPASRQGNKRAQKHEVR